jgi:YHYH protein
MRSSMTIVATGLLTPLIAFAVSAPSSITALTSTANASDTKTAMNASASYLPASSLWVQKSSKVDPTALPLDDQHYTTSGPKKGYVYVCKPKMFQRSKGPVWRARQVGSWVNQAKGTYDVTKKIFIGGHVTYSNASFSDTVLDGLRHIVSNGLPVGGFTGIFPVQRTDPAHSFFPNPNSIQLKNISFSIPADPKFNRQIGCIYKQVGITLDGIPLHNALNSVGDNELAHVGQDLCLGASQPNGGYHRHGLSDCTPHMRENAALVGYALDGFGIYSPYDQNGNELTTADLDECHGTTSPVMWNGRIVNMYHYVMTRDFPYTVACFKGTAVRNAFPPLGAQARPESPGQLPVSSSSPGRDGFARSRAPQRRIARATDQQPRPNSYSGIDTSCAVFVPDNDTRALTRIASRPASTCQRALANLSQLYAQFEGKTCTEMQQIFSSAANRNRRPPPVPNGTIYKALVACSQK